jgi:large subunit ribosomal protein L24
MALKQHNPRYTFKSKLRKGDEVIVLAGKSKGETAKIDAIDKKTGVVFLSGKHTMKRHQKPDLQNQDGGIVDMPAPLHISNVALVDAKSKKGTRVGYKIDGDKKSRIAKKSKATV